MQKCKNKTAPSVCYSIVQVVTELLNIGSDLGMKKGAENAYGRGNLTLIRDSEMELSIMSSDGFSTYIPAGFVVVIEWSDDRGTFDVMPERVFESRYKAD